MTIDTVSDVFAFAVKHPEYWELLSPESEDQLSELDNEGQRKAFDAAREHVQESYEALLLACLEELKARVPAGDPRYKNVRDKRPQSAVTRKNQYVDILLVAGKGLLTWFQLRVEEDWDEEAIRLYASFQTKKENRAVLRALRPPERPLVDEVDGLYYFGHIEIPEGARYADLARQLVDAVWPTLAAYMDRLLPVGGET